MEIYEYMYDNYYSYDNFIVITIIVMTTLLSLLLSKKKDSISYVRHLHFVLYDYITK